MRTAVSTALGLALSMLSGCQARTGSGRVVTVDYPAAAFSRVSLTALHANVTHGARHVSLTADDNLLDAVLMAVHDDTLFATLRPNIAVEQPSTLELSISNDVLEGLTAADGALVTASATATVDFSLVASGASHVVVDSLSTNTATITASGASTVAVKGNALSSQLTASGVSAIDSKDLAVDDSRVDLSGNSIARVKARQLVGGWASGASVVSIVGQPTVQVIVSGGSRVDSTGQ